MTEPATGDEWRRARFAASPFAVLATHGPDGRIDLVPCCFALVTATDGGDEVVTAVDHKPKRSTRLARLVNIERNPAASLLVDHRDPDNWSRLWWVRVSGTGRVETSGDAWRAAIEALVEKYEHYQRRPPEGAAIRLQVERWSGWAP